MAAFLFALTLVLGIGGGINAENAGKAGLYAESPAVLADDVVEAVSDAYKTGEPITQEIYAQRYNG